MFKLIKDIITREKDPPPLNSRKYRALKKEYRESEAWLFDQPNPVVIDKNTPPILVYQMGKVGSTSISDTLSESDIPNPVYHLHQLTHSGLDFSIHSNRLGIENNLSAQNIDDRRRLYNHLYFQYLLRQLESHKKLRQKIDAHRHTVPWKIITLVRDPIKREISNFFFSFHQRPELLDQNGRFRKKKSLEALQNGIQNTLTNPESWTLNWFKKEFQQVFGLDIYAHPFPKKKGCTVIRHGNLEVLVFKLEMLNRCFSQGIAELIDREDLKLLDRNTAKQKFYYDIYRHALDHIDLDRSFCERVYRSRLVQHFYTPGEIDGFIAKWSGT